MSTEFNVCPTDSRKLQYTALSTTCCRSSQRNFADVSTHCLHESGED